jgi:hypothetical protein
MNCYVCDKAGRATPAIATCPLQRGTVPGALGRGPDRDQGSRAQKTSLHPRHRPRGPGTPTDPAAGKPP